MNFWDIFLLLLIGGAVALGIRRMHRLHQSGKSCCGDCASCGRACGREEGR